MPQKRPLIWRLALPLSIFVLFIACGSLASIYLMMSRSSSPSNANSNANRLGNFNANTSNFNANTSSTPQPLATPLRKPVPKDTPPRSQRQTLSLLGSSPAVPPAVNERISDSQTFTEEQYQQFLRLSVGRLVAGGATRENVNENSRYPTIESPDQVPVNHEFAVQVSLTEDLMSPEVTIVSGATTKDRKQLTLDLPTQTDRASWPISVVLSAPGFEILGGKNQDTLVLPKDGDAPPVVFQLKPKPIPTSQQPGRLFVTFYFNGTFLGRAMREVTITNGTSSVTNSASSAREAIVSRPAPAPGGGRASGTVRRESEDQVEVDSYSKVPDLTIYVRDYPGMNHTDSSEIQINSPKIPINVSSFPRPNGLEAWLNSKYREFARLSSRGTVVVSEKEEQLDKESAASLLRGFGRELYQKFAPPAFKEAFWKLVDESNAPGSNFKLKSIQIYSDNPILPWELMRPVRADGSDEREFLGMEFNVGRWHVSEGGPIMDKPPQIVYVAGLYLIAPEYQGSQVLPGQQDEIAALSAFHGYKRVPGQFHDLAALLTKSPSGIIHFAGHGVIRAIGEDVPEYFILLEDGDLDPLRWRGIVTTRTDSHQFVFFNACDVGQVSRVANFVNGWAPAVLETGASGYVGALWPLGDKAAAKFAIHFYQALEQRADKGPVSVADVLRDTRRMFLEENDPTYLAYVYYGDPNLRLSIR